MASYHFSKYRCKKCNTEMQTKKCPVCKTSNVGIPPVFVRFRVIENGELVQKKLSGFSTKKQAEDSYRNFLADYKPSYNKIESNVSYIYEDMLKLYLKANANGTKPSTQYEKPQIFARFITPYFEKKDIRKITKQDICLWRDNLWGLTYSQNEQQIKYAHRYLKKVWGNFHNFFVYCNEAFSVGNPMKGVKTPKNTDPVLEITFWELDTFNKFISTIDNILYNTLFTFAFYTGMRIGEIQAFRESDLSDITIHVCKTYSNKTVDGNSYNIVPLKNYKNYYKNIPNILRDKLTKYIDWKRKSNIPADFLFGGNKPIHLNTISRHLDFYIAKFNKDNEKINRITPHGFRHSYVSLLANLGCSTQAIASLIGDREEQVIRTYAHLYKDIQSQAIERMNNLVSKM